MWGPSAQSSAGPFPNRHSMSSAFKTSEHGNDDDNDNNGDNNDDDDGGNGDNGDMQLYKSGALRNPPLSPFTNE